MERWWISGRTEAACSKVSQWDRLPLFISIDSSCCLGPAWGKMVTGPHVFRVGGHWG